ncbi:MAG: hypothetical protein OXF98_02075 [Rhodospirillaceae bacterium]|nr:hypothetical protein [Rhodospirillaceae bacterium]
MAAASASPLSRAISACLPLAVLLIAVGWVAARGTITSLFLGEVLLAALGLALAGQFVFLANRSYGSAKRRAWIYTAMAAVALVSAFVLAPAHPRLATLLAAAPWHLTLAAAGQ